MLINQITLSVNINIIKHPQSQPHALENITIALDAIQEDGIKLVNIGERFCLSTAG